MSANKTNTIIDLEAALEYCEKCAEVAEGLRDKCYDSVINGTGPDVVLSSIPYFTQQAQMYRHDIPAVLKEIAKQQSLRNNGGKSDE